MVLSVSSRVFVGQTLCRDQGWLQVVSAYLAEVVATARVLRPYPPVLRSILRPLLAPKSRIARIIERAQEVLDPAIRARQQSPDDYIDLLGFLVKTSRDEQTKPIVLKLLVLTSAAVRIPCWLQR